MAVDQRVTFCRICEAHCGMVATVEDGRRQKLRPDQEHPLSQGFACPKGIAMTDVQNDPDRVTAPARAGRGRDVRARLAGTTRSPTSAAPARRPSPTHGRAVDRLVLRQPGRVHALARAVGQGLPDAARLAAPLHGLARRTSATASPRARLLYGSPARRPDPRPRADGLPAHRRRQPARLARQRADGAADQGPAARDRRRAAAASSSSTRAASRRRARFEHLADHARRRRLAAAVAAVACSFEEGLDGRGGAGAPRPTAAPRCARPSRAFPPEETAARTGIDAEHRARARTRPRGRAERGASTAAPAPASGASARSSRSCSTRQRSSTGNLDRAGRRVFGLARRWRSTSSPRRLGLGTYGKIRSRIGDFPEVLGALPASLMAQEIDDARPRPAAALFVSAPATRCCRCPTATRWRRRSGRWTCTSRSTSTSTRRTATPTTCCPRRRCYERDDLPLAFLDFHTTPFVEYDRGGRAAARRGAPGVADHRRDSPREIGIARPASSAPLARRWSKLGTG